MSEANSESLHGGTEHSSTRMRRIWSDEKIVKITYLSYTCKSLEPTYGPTQAPYEQMPFDRANDRPRKKSKKNKTYNSGEMIVRECRYMMFPIASWNPLRPKGEMNPHIWLLALPSRACHIRQLKEIEETQRKPAMRGTSGCLRSTSTACLQSRWYSSHLTSLKKDQRGNRKEKTRNIAWCMYHLITPPPQVWAAVS